ncbi:hypothetical protein Q9S36_16020 [Microbacterium sp. ARD31]|uniref:hypothetical protein n=1 Tax=Microbacterium sp. ARD31 TaxID=2962576 RepID=UPI002881C534|nr:hypothetical protein [Microbacterium sp. ARD31]MDT0181684.1 hypothetical protein [Microbacterium sp. ARD31]
MDAGDRAELDELRRRAYGPRADIAEDVAAMARLEELEASLRAESATTGSAGGESRVPGASAVGRTAPDAAFERGAPTAERAEDAASASLAPSRRPRRRVAVAFAIAGALVVGAGAAGVALDALDEPVAERPPAAGESAAPPDSGAGAADDDDAVALRIPLDGFFDNDVDVDSASDVPDFPTTGSVQWASALGDYYGWEMWIAGADGASEREYCLLIEQELIVRARCVSAQQRAQGTLIVSVPYSLVDPRERPEPMSPGDQLAFRWDADATVTVSVGTSLAP